ncbi:hypothetical protein ACFX12_009237 [Malus domestica]
MASRAVVVPQQARGEAAVAERGGGRPLKKNVVAAGDGRRRTALGDIGNVVIDGKPNRPVTRSFCAQLLANAQAAAAAQNNKKQIGLNVKRDAPVVVDGVKRAEVPKEVAAVAQKKVNAVVDGVKRAEVPKEVAAAAQKKVNVNQPIAREVKATEEESNLTAKAVNKKKEADGTSRKKAPTYTSVLTARSKAACGVTDKPKSHNNIVDIDANDAGNELAAVEYIEDMYKFYKLVENENRPHDYMDSQPEINENMRAILVDWLVDVHTKFELSPETFYLAINIIDRFLAVKIVPRKELQLVGISAMLIASKYEEIWAPEVNDFVCLSDRAYTHSQILIMEKKILGKLEWTLTVPTLYVFLVRFIKASIPDHQMENMVYFLAELATMHYTTTMYCPSMIAASAVHVAKCTLNKSPVWSETLKLHTGFSEPQLRDCSKLLASLHAMATKSKLQGVYSKYSNSEHGAVALLPPAKALLARAGTPSTSTSITSIGAAAAKARVV